MWRYRWFRWYHVCLLNLTWICWCIIETSLGLPRKSSAIFGNLQEFSEILGKCSETFVWPSEQFWKSSEIFGKWSEIFGKSSKTPSSVCLYNKRTLHVSSKIWILCSRGKNNISLVRCAHSWDICFRHSNIKLISSRHRVISLFNPRTVKAEWIYLMLNNLC